MRFDVAQGRTARAGWCTCAHGSGWMVYVCVCAVVRVCECACAHEAAADDEQPEEDVDESKQ